MLLAFLPAIMAGRRLFILCLLTFLGTGLGAGLWLFGNRPLHEAELAAGDLIARHGRLTPANPKLIFLAIDNDSVTIEADTDLKEFFGIADEKTVEARALKKMSAHWPWPRSVYALIIDRLVAAGAKAVVLDLNFPTPSADDTEFRAALERHRDRVVIGSNFVSATRRGRATIAATHTLPAPTLIAQTGHPDNRVGFVNLWTDADEVVRSANFRLSLAELEGYADPNAAAHFSLAAQAVRKVGRADLVPNDMRDYIVRLTGMPHHAFPPRSLFEIFVPEYWERNYRSGAVFKDALVVIGAAGNWQHDEHPTAFGLMPGPELQLNIINALLHGEFIRSLSPAMTLALIVAAGFLPLVCFRTCRTPLPRLLLIVLIGIAWAGAALLLYNRASIALPIVAPLLTLGINGFLGFIHDLAVARSERRRLRTTLERYVSKNVVREMIEQPADYMQSLGGVARPATILFSDIRNFTRVCADTSAQALVTQLNEYLTAMVACVFLHEGTLDKFMGDAVMAVWGNAKSHGPAEDARRAAFCALSMREELAKLNARWRYEGRPVFEIGIALNHGEVIVGNIGSPQRMEFTVIGDAVNASWRLQERTKQHGCEIIVGENVVDLIGAGFETESLGVLRMGAASVTHYSQLLARTTEPAARFISKAPDQTQSSTADPSFPFSRPAFSRNTPAPP